MLLSAEWAIDQREIDGNKLRRPLLLFVVLSFGCARMLGRILRGHKLAGDCTAVYCYLGCHLIVLLPHPGRG